MEVGSINRVTLVGHLGADPESRATPAGVAVASFNLATNEIYLKDGESESRTEWHRCVLFGKPAEKAIQRMKKGQLVFLGGKLRTHDWEDKEGIRRYSTEVIGDTFTLLGKQVVDESLESEEAEVPEEAGVSGEEVPA